MSVEHKGGRIVIAPMVFPGNVPEEPFDCGRGVFLERLPEQLRTDEKTLRNLNPWATQRIERNANAMLRVEADDFSPDVRRLQLCAMCLWIVKPSLASPICYGQYRVEQDDLVYEQVWDTRPFGVGPGDFDGTLFDLDRLREARRLHLALQGLAVKGSGPVGAVMKYLSHALPESYDLKYLLHWISLEALFGEDNGIKKSLSVNIPAFLETELEAAKEMLHAVKRGYKIRCQIAHGDPVLKDPDNNEVLEGEKSTQLMEELQEWIRRVLRKILLDETLAEMFCEKIPRPYLRELPLRDDLRAYYKAITQPQ